MKKLCWLLVLLAVPLPGLASAEREHPDREPHPLLCNMQRVNECVALNQKGQAEDLARAAALEPSVQALATELQLARSHKDLAEAKLTATRLEKRLLVLEQRSTAEKPTFVPVMAGFPPLEDFFHLHPLEKNWRDLYPSERREKLTAALAVQKAEETSLATDFEQIFGKFQRLTSEFQSAQKQRDDLLASANGHAYASARWCRESICQHEN